MQDPISDLLTRIRNAQSVKKMSVKSPCSKVKIAILKVLQLEGYIDNFNVIVNQKGKKEVEIILKYHEGKAVIAKLSRVSKPSLRIYRGQANLPKVLGGLGIAIISTSKGIMSDKKARQVGCGGEVLCFVE